MKEEHMEKVVEMVNRVLMNIDDEGKIGTVKKEVKEFMRQFPLYEELA
jgi:glycine hydroxymethyltransferase